MLCSSEYASIDDFDVGGDLIRDYTAALMDPTPRSTPRNADSADTQDEEEVR